MDLSKIFSGKRQAVQLQKLPLFFLEGIVYFGDREENENGFSAKIPAVKGCSLLLQWPAFGLLSSCCTVKKLDEESLGEGSFPGECWSRCHRPRVLEGSGNSARKPTQKTLLSPLLCCK